MEVRPGGRPLLIIRGGSVPDQSATAQSTECLLAGASVANPRRLRVGRDGRPLPVEVSAEQSTAA